MAQSNGDETRKELERLYKCVAYDRIDDVDRMELWIKEVGIVVEKLSAQDRKKHELEARLSVIDNLLDTFEDWGEERAAELIRDHYIERDALEADREGLGK